MAYEVTIGIEIHCELKTNTKMFSNSEVHFDGPVNTYVNEVDLGLPGTLPTVNKKAVEYALKLCHALNMEIEPLLRFDRKNYFYSDLPKGFQITQQFHPIGEHGILPILVDYQEKKIGVTRLHLEEDTAKQHHLEDKTLIDFNRAGVPLIEIVSEPQIHSAKEAAAYVLAMRELVVYLGVSDGKMEEGSMRCDVNISLAKEGSDKLGTKVEIKNLNSINNVQKAIEKEIERQTKALENNEEIVQSTRRFDESIQDTVLMREKEGAVDYRYFPEPNIFPILLEEQFVKSVKDNLIELPHDRYLRYVNELEIDPVNASILVANKNLSDYFDELNDDKTDPVRSSNYLISEVMSYANKNNEDLFDLFDVIQLRKLISLLGDKTLSSKQGKMVLPEILYKENTVDEIIDKLGLKQESDPVVIQNWIDEILENNPSVIEDFLAGKDKSIKFVMGQVMKLSRGQANPAMANKMVKQTLLSKKEN